VTDDLVGPRAVRGDQRRCVVVQTRIHQRRHRYLQRVEGIVQVPGAGAIAVVTWCLKIMRGP
jgi:hypothetical protein